MVPKILASHARRRERGLFRDNPQAMTHLQMGGVE